MRAQILAGRVAACHDVSDGGLLVAVAEMALAGDTGVDLLPRAGGGAPHAFWFGEDQARYVLAVADGAALPGGRGGGRHAGRDASGARGGNGI